MKGTRDLQIWKNVFPVQNGKETDVLTTVSLKEKPMPAKKRLLITMV